MKQPLLDVELVRERDLQDVPTGGLRLSIYFDRRGDNHHTIFEKNEERRETIAKLRALARAIEKVAQ